MSAGEVGMIRDIVLVGQGGAGKTALGDALLFVAGAVSRVGRTADGSSAFDFDPEELRRKISISAALHHLTWRKHRITLIDTPGYANFLVDTRHCLRAATGAVLVLGPTGDDLKVETEKIWGWLDELELPRVVFVTRMDRERADLEAAVATIKGLGARPAVLTMPVGQEHDFRGVVDLLAMRAHLAQGEAGGSEEREVPGELAASAAKAREQLVEVIAEASDELLERYLEGGELADEELRGGLRTGTRARKFVPVVCGSAERVIGLGVLLDTLIACLPSPAELPPARGDNPKTGEEVECAPDPEAPFSALVFKTVVDPFAGKLSIFRVFSGRAKSDSNVYNASKDARERLGQLLRLEGKKQAPVAEAVAGEVVAVAKLKETATGDTLCDERAPVVFASLAGFAPAISFALQPRTKGDEDKVMQSLAKLMEEDTGISVHRDPQTKEIVLSGVGQLHVEVVVERLKRKYGVDVDLKAPKVPYKETIKGSARAQGKYKKQTGGRGQYGDTWLEVQPLPRGTGFEFEDRIVGGVIPRQFIPAVEKGVREALQEGILAGYPVVDLKVILYDGSHHVVDSSEMSFKIAGSIGVKKAMEEARPVLLEPVMVLEVTCPDDAMGDVIGDLNSRRGKVLGVDSRGHTQVIRAHVPMAETLRYAPDLRSMTSGRGDFTMEFSHYEEAPSHVAERVVREARRAREQQ